jgi:hypothetical protein
MGLESPFKIRGVCATHLFDMVWSKGRRNCNARSEGGAFMPLKLSFTSSHFSAICIHTIGTHQFERLADFIVGKLGA